MTESKRAKIVFSGIDEDTPLLCFDPQRNQEGTAYLTLSLDSGEVDAQCCVGTGHSMPLATAQALWHRRTLSWKLNAALAGWQVKTLMEMLLPKLQLILAGASVDWNGKHWIGSLVTEDALKAAEELDAHCIDGLGYDLWSSSAQHSTIPRHRTSAYG